MTNEQALTVSQPLAIAEYDPQEVALIVKENTGGRLSAFDLARVHIPTGGGTVWDLGTEAGKTFDAVILYQRAVRAYWSRPLEESGNQPPDCRSNDLEMGIGDPGGLCAVCPFNDFGTARTGGGKACRETKMLFVLQPDSLIPSLLIVPPTSLKNVRQYMLGLASKGAPYYGVLTRFALERVDGRGNPYSRLVLANAGKLTDADLARIRALATALAPALSDSVPAASDLPEGEQG